MLLTKEKSFYRLLLRLVIPIMLQNVMNLCLQLTDTVMLGLLPSGAEEAISAASLANKPFFLYSLFIFGTVSGMVVLVSQYYGRGDMKSVHSVGGMAYLCGISLGAVFTAVCFVCSPQVMSLFTKSEAVIGLGSDYMRIVLFSYIPSAVIIITNGLLRSTEQVRPPLYASIMSILMNIVLNYLLIFGKLGLPAMGVCGAALATLISKLCELVFCLVYVIFFEKKLKLHLKTLLTLKKALVADFFKYSAPVILNETLWGLGVTVHASILGNLGDESYAAYTIANIIEQIALLATFGVANASAIIIGKELGSGRLNDAYLHAKTLLTLSTASGIATAVLLYLVRRPIINMYNVSAVTKEYAGYILLVMMFMIAFKSFNTPIIVGVLRSGGDTVAAMLLDFVPMWVFAIPLGFVAARVFHLPVYLVYAVLMSDEAIKTAFGIARFKSKKWVRNITRQ